MRKVVHIQACSSPTSCHVSSVALVGGVGGERPASESVSRSVWRPRSRSDIPSACAISIRDEFMTQKLIASSTVLHSCAASTANSTSNSLRKPQSD